MAVSRFNRSASIVLAVAAVLFAAGAAQAQQLNPFQPPPVPSVPLLVPHDYNQPSRPDYAGSGHWPNGQAYPPGVAPGVTLMPSDPNPPVNVMGGSPYSQFQSTNVMR